jgi:hypothetical protein
LLINKKIKLFTSLFTCFQNQYTRVLMKWSLLTFYCGQKWRITHLLNHIM